MKTDFEYLEKPTFQRKAKCELCHKRFVKKSEMQNICEICEDKRIAEINQAEAEVRAIEAMEEDWRQEQKVE